MDWHFEREKAVRGEWPKDEKGESVAAAFLTHTGGGGLDAEMVRSLLDSFNIPSVCQYPNDGVFGTIILGIAGGGVDIFVPETMLEDAQNIINADNIENTTEEEE